jgi:hypothetical protein
MNTLQNTETGTILFPAENNNKVVMSGKVNTLPELTKNAVNKLISTTNFQFFEGKTGKHYLIYIDESPSSQIPAGAIEIGWGEGKKYNPKPIYQRPSGQHSTKIQKSILLDFLCGERIGTLVFYKENRTSSEDVVDGVQRGTIIYNFLTNNLMLQGNQASKFWAYWFHEIVKGASQIHTPSLSNDCIKLLNSIINNKSIPAVKFENLPMNIKQEIRQLTVDYKNITSVKFWCLEDQEIISFDNPDYDESKVIEMIRFKFNKLNLQQKPVQPIHLIWGSSSIFNSISRSYVQSNPHFLSLLGYGLEGKEDKDEQKLRTINEIIVRSMLNFDKQLKWGVGATTFSENLLDGVYEDPKYASKSKLFMETFLPKRLGKVFTEEFVDNNSNIRRIEIAKELVGEKQRTVIQRVFFLGLMTFSNYIMENKLTSKYFSGENPTTRLFNFVELLSKVTSTLSLISLDKENWTNSDAKPILRKYELVDMYNQNDKLFYDFIRLSRNARSDDGMVLNLIEQIVEMVDNNIV